MSEKEARSTLLGASFPVPCFPPKEPGDAYESLPPSHKGWGSRLQGWGQSHSLAQYIRCDLCSPRGREPHCFSLTLELGTAALQLFICFRGKAEVLSWERIAEGPSLPGSQPRSRIRGSPERSHPEECADLRGSCFPPQTASPPPFLGP